jgi:preprotein translocase subunit YajC
VEGQASSLIFLVFLVAIFYFMLIRPQKRRVQQHKSLMDSLEVGDEIVTIGGLYGTIASLSDDDLELDVAEGTTMRFVKTSVARKVVAPDEDDLAPEEQEEEEEESR